MNKRRLASRLMLTGGIAEIIIAILHFLMPLQFIRAGEIAELSADYQSFVFHGIVAVGLCLTVFGALSIHFSRKLLLGEETAWVYGVSQGILWTGRTISELIFPVRVPFVFPAEPDGTGPSTGCINCIAISDSTTDVQKDAYRETTGGLTVRKALLLIGGVSQVAFGLFHLWLSKQIHSLQAIPSEVRATMQALNTATTDLKVPQGFLMVAIAGLIWWGTVSIESSQRPFS